MEKNHKLVICLATLSLCMAQKNFNNLQLIKSKKYSKIEENTIDNEEDNFEYNGFLDKMFDAHLDGDNKTTIFYGTSSADFGNIKFVNTFKQDEMIFNLNYELNGKNYDKTQEAFINENGLLDANINFNELDDTNTYQLSNYTDLEDMQNLYDSALVQYSSVSTNSLTYIIVFIVAALVMTFTTIANVNYKKQTDINYAYNQKLESNNQGLEFKKYIYDQTGEKDINNCDKYQFGYTTFSEVGCEVAFVYNLELYRENPRYLSSTIYDFEKWEIEFKIGFGYLGSKARKIYKYFKNHSIKYKKYTSEKKFKDCISDSDCIYIMTSLNKGIKGYHTYFIEQFKNKIYDENVESNNHLLTYNLDCSNKAEPKSNVDVILSQTSGFYCGYYIKL